MSEVGREKDWEILPVVDMWAMPGATVADAIVDLFWAEFQAVADSEAMNGVDGVFVILHGASYPHDLGYRDELERYGLQHGLQ